MKLPILYSSKDDTVVLYRQTIDKYIELVGTCAMRWGAKFEECPEMSDADGNTRDSILTRDDFKEFKPSLPPCMNKAEIPKEQTEFEQETVRQLREMLEKCPVKDSAIAESLKKQIDTIENSLVPDYNYAEAIMLNALVDAGCIYDPVLEDLVHFTVDKPELPDFKNVQRGDLILAVSADKRTYEYIVFDSYEDNFVNFQCRCTTSLDRDDNDRTYSSHFFQKTIIPLNNESVYFVHNIQKFVNDLRTAERIPVSVEDGRIEIGYTRQIEQFVSECDRLEPKDDCVYRTEIAGRPALIEFNADWRSSKRFNMILFTDDFTIEYPKDSSVNLKPADIQREANDYEYTAFKAVANEFTGQDKSGNRYDGFERFGVTDERVSPVMGCSGCGHNSIIDDYPQEYANDMLRFKTLRDGLRPGDVLEIMPVRSHGAGKAFIRYTGEHPEEEPENWFQFDAMETFGIVSTFFTQKEKPVAVVSYASSILTGYMKDFRKKVFALEEECFEPENDAEKELFEQHRLIAEEDIEARKGLYVVLSQTSGKNPWRSVIDYDSNDWPKRDK